MFQALTNNFSKICNKLRNSTSLSEEQISLIMREIRIALLEADVPLMVIKDFISNVTTKAKGKEIIRSVTPGQMVIKIINEEMVKILQHKSKANSIEKDYKNKEAGEKSILNIKGKSPVNMMVVGLQGGGKTTTTVKLAVKLKQQHKKVMVVSLDIARPAAREQLEILATKENILSLPIIKQENILQILERSQQEARLLGCDVIIYDTAGRLHIDELMLQELQQIKQITNPNEILLVVDSLIGQESVNIATTFDQKLDISGVILTRIDGDSRGGAALGIKYVTGKPIKFLATGEKINDIEEFHPERIASRILGRGDIVSLVEKASSLIEQEEAEKAANKLKKGKFDLEDYLQQLQSIKKFGGINNMLNFIPGINKMLSQINQNQLNENMFKQQEAIILSMTKQERTKPEIINASRKKRIAAGSGTSVQKINQLMKQFKQVTDLVKKTGKLNTRNLLGSQFSKFKNLFS